MNEIILLSVIAIQSVFIIGLGVALLRKPHHEHHEKQIDKTHAGSQATAPVDLPRLTEQDLEQLKTQARQAFQTAVDEGATTFHADLQQTSEQLNKLIIRITTDVVEKELEEYRSNLKTARENALNSLQEMQTAVDSKRKDLEADLDTELVKRRDALSARIDKKLGTAVAAYIVESLGQGADLGAQRKFMLESLERHKADLKKELEGGV